MGAGKKLSSAKKERRVSAKAKAKAQRRPSLMDHLKFRLKAHNDLIGGKADPSVLKSVIAPPPMGDDGDEEKETELDRTGLGLANLPQHMSMAMLEESEDEESSASEWNSDD